MLISRVYNNNSYYTKFRLPSFMYERYIIKWKPNHETIIHNHKSPCKYMLLKGKLKEIKYKDNQVINTKILNILEENEIKDINIKHKVINMDNKLSFSYHVYNKI